MTTTITQQEHRRTDAVDRLCGRLAGRGDQIEGAGRLPDDIAADLRASGIYRMWLPRELGGSEAEPGAVIAAVEALAAADGSVGWCAAIGLASNVISGYLPRAGAEKMYPTGTEVTGGSLMPGGRATRNANHDLVVDGRWSFASGAHHCDWLAGVAAVDGDSGPEAMLVVMPRAETDLLDTWHVAGLKGTGSTDFEAHHVFVPRDRTVPLGALQTWPAGGMWKIPLHSLLLPVMAAVPLGIARAALTELTRLATKKTPFRSTRTLAERDTTRAAIARATAGVDAAHGYLASALTALFDTASAGVAPTLNQRAAARLAAVHATHNAARAVEACYRTAGTTALFTNSPLQRHLRDINATTQHYALSHNGYETIGQVLLGFDPDVPI